MRNSKLFKTILLIISFVLLSNITVFADSGLPDQDLFKVDLGFSSEIASPIFLIVNWVVGLYGLKLLVNAIWSLLKIAANLFSGGDLKGSMNKLKELGAGVFILLITITGAWYKFLYFIWDRINPKIEQELALAAAKFIEFI